MTSETKCFSFEQKVSASYMPGIALGTSYGAANSTDPDLALSSQGRLGRHRSVMA